MYLYYVIAFFVGLLLYSVIKKKWAISTYIIAIYLFTLIVALFIEEIFPFYEDSKKGAIVFVSGISLFLLPYLRNEPIISGTSDSASLNKILSISKLISLFLIVLGFLILPTVIDSLSVGIENLREGERTFKGDFISLFFLKLMDFFYPLSYSLLTIFFYLYTFIRGHSVEKALIFLASLSAPYFGIVAGGRTQMIYWLLSLGFNYILFYKYLSPSKRKQSIRIGFIFVFFILIYIIYATIERFGNSEKGVQDSLLLYTGQSYLHFNRFIENFDPEGMGTLRRIFPFTYSIINGYEPITAYREIVESRSGMDIGIFYTLLGDLFVDVGLIGMYIYAIVYFILSTLVLKKKSLDLSSLLIVSLLFLIPLQGVFYYSFYKRQVTFCAFLVFIFSRMIKPNRR